MKDEALLYTNRLLAQLRAANPAFTAAALAQPGREIDGHLAQLLKWGDEIRPDLIIYQWYVNDLELDKSQRPSASGRVWRQLFFHGPLLRYSYLWFFLDFILDVKLPSSSQSYEDYLTAQFGASSEGWARFTQMFHAWSAAARRLTPHVIVVLMPDIQEHIELADFHHRMIELCQEDGIVALDLIPWFDIFKNDYSQTFATPFDDHPNARAHERIAQALYRTLEVTWPALVRRPSEQSSSPDCQ